MERPGHVVSQKELGEKLGVHRNEVGLWWKGFHWQQRREPDMEALLGIARGFFQRIGSGASYEELISSPFASSRLAPPALRAVGDVVSEPHVYELVQQGGEHDMEGGKRYEAEELGRRVREALLMEPANPDVARVLRRHQDTLKGSVEALTELIFRVGKPAVVS